MQLKIYRKHHRIEDSGMLDHEDTPLSKAFLILSLNQYADFRCHVLPGTSTFCDNYESTMRYRLRGCHGDRLVVAVQYVEEWAQYSLWCTQFIGHDF